MDKMKVATHVTFNGHRQKKDIFLNFRHLPRFSQEKLPQ
jgi:hypothetical protein